MSARAASWRCAEGDGDWQGVGIIDLDQTACLRSPPLEHTVEFLPIARHTPLLVLPLEVLWVYSRYVDDLAMLDWRAKECSA